MILWNPSISINYVWSRSVARLFFYMLLYHTKLWYMDDEAKYIFSKWLINAWMKLYENVCGLVVWHCMSIYDIVIIIVTIVTFDIVTDWLHH